MLSDDNFRQLRSQRVQNVDLNQGSTLDRFDVIAEELGLRIPCNVWTLDSKSGEFGLASCWTREDFEAAGIIV